MRPILNLRGPFSDTKQQIFSFMERTNLANSKFYAVICWIFAFKIWEALNPTNRWDFIISDFVGKIQPMLTPLKWCAKITLFIWPVKTVKSWRLEMVHLNTAGLKPPHCVSLFSDLSLNFPYICKFKMYNINSFPVHSICVNSTVRLSTLYLYSTL